MGGTSGNGFAVNNRAFENYLLIKPPLPNDVITCAERAGDIIYAGSRTGLYKINFREAFVGKIFTNILKDKIITAVATDHNKNIWAGIQGEGIYVLNKDGKILKKISPLNSSLITGSVLHLSADRKGRILISTILGFILPRASMTLL